MAIRTRGSIAGVPRRERVDRAPSLQLLNEMRVLLYEGDDAEWDAFVRRQPDWTHFHLAGWREVMRRVFRHECPYLVARGTDCALVGVLPLVRVRSALFGHYLVSMPLPELRGAARIVRRTARLG